LGDNYNYTMTGIKDKDYDALIMNRHLLEIQLDKILIAEKGK
jgi:hypothetical protein